MSTRMTGGVLGARPALRTNPTRNSSMTNHVKSVAILSARPGKVAELRALLDGMTTPSRSEPGNLRYDLWQDQTDPIRFVLDELYVDSDAVVAHRTSAHFQNYLAAIADLAERTAVTLDPASVA
jgi:quinol monooxygenase YgiN